MGRPPARRPGVVETHPRSTEEATVTARPVLALALALAAARPAAAAKVPAVVNIGIGPTVGTVFVPGLDGPPPISVGLAVQAEGWVSGKTLHSRKVMKRVPKRYRGMARNMDDLHVVPLPVALVPDQALVAPLPAGASEAAVRGVGWTPLSVYLAHQVKPVHLALAASPRVAWVNYDLVASDAAAATNSALLGLDLGLDAQTRMGKPVGVAAGFNVAPGWLFGNPDPSSGAAGAFGVWTDGWLRLQLRRKIKVKL